MAVEVQRSGLEGLGFDLERLLAPIAGGNPAGESLRYEGTYDLIQEARREDDPTLPQGVWKTELKKADWSEVAALCLRALEEKTKDLQVGAWLLEAWLHLFGLAGVEGGFRVLTGLCREFWPELYPQLEEGDLEARVAPLEWINDKVTLQLKRLPMSDRESGEGRLYSWVDWERALYSAESRAAESDAEGGSEAEGTVTRTKFLAQVSVTSTAFYRQLARDLDRARSAVHGLEAQLAECCGEAGPSLGSFRGVIDEMDRFVTGVLKERQASEPPEVIPMADSAELRSPGERESVEAGEAPAPGSIQEGITPSSRAEAYRLLSVAADFLLRSEPHSPAPYLVRRAIAWGGMSLGEVLNELLRDGADLSTVYKLLGIRQPQKDQ